MKSAEKSLGARMIWLNAIRPYRKRLDLAVVIQYWIDCDDSLTQESWDSCYHTIIDVVPEDCIEDLTGWSLLCSMDILIGVNDSAYKEKIKKDEEIRQEVLNLRKAVKEKLKYEYYDYYDFSYDVFHEGSSYTVEKTGDDNILFGSRKCTHKFVDIDLLLKRYKSALGLPDEFLELITPEEKECSIDLEVVPEVSSDTANLLKLVDECSSDVDRLDNFRLLRVSMELVKCLNRAGTESIDAVISPLQKSDIRNIKRYTLSGEDVEHLWRLIFPPRFRKGGNRNNLHLLKQLPKLHQSFWDKFYKQKLLNFSDHLIEQGYSKREVDTLKALLNPAPCHQKSRSGDQCRSVHREEALQLDLSCFSDFFNKNNDIDLLFS